MSSSYVLPPWYDTGRARLNALWAFLTGRQERPTLYLASRDGQTVHRSSDPQEDRMQNIETSPKVLKKLFDQVEPFTAKKSSVPVLRAVWLEHSAFDITMKATDMESFAIGHSLSGGPCHYGKTVLDAASFKNVLDIFKESKSVKLALKENLIVEVTDGKTTYDMRALPTEDFPKQPELTGRIVDLTIDDAVLAEAMGYVLPVAAKDETRPTLCAVAVAVVNGWVNLVATDSYRLHLEHIEPMFKTSLPDGNYPISRWALASMSKMFGKNPGAWSFEFSVTEPGISGPLSGPHVRITAQGAHFQVYARVIDGQYVNYRQLFPDLVDGVYVESDGDALRKAVEPVKKLLKNTNCPMRLSFSPETGTVNMEVAGEQQDVGSIKNEVQVKTFRENPTLTEFAIGVNPDFFADAIKGAEEVSMYFLTPLRPLQVWPGFPGRQALLMPIRLND